MEIPDRVQKPETLPCLKASSSSPPLLLSSSPSLSIKHKPTTEDTCSHEFFSHISSPRLRSKSVSPLPPIGILGGEALYLALDPIPVPSPQPKKTPSPSHLSLRSSTNSLPLQELLLLSPPLFDDPEPGSLKERKWRKKPLSRKAIEDVARAELLPWICRPLPPKKRKEISEANGARDPKEMDEGLCDKVGKPRRRKQEAAMKIKVA
ncbi:uncharacterized protein LOC122070226 [Macadamia integrifolia]|uniref:uncharacterized protein LOC122070226 n=1 Tax=Macadamia integrifolia TaxID=60698 RepID=UPI001C4E7493|nr:uncharacterized protein LOC122070226 [Macadamia integrifolia]